MTFSPCYSINWSPGKGKIRLFPRHAPLSTRESYSCLSARVLQEFPNTPDTPTLIFFFDAHAYPLFGSKPLQPCSNLLTPMFFLFSGRIRLAARRKILSDFSGYRQFRVHFIFSHGHQDQTSFAPGGPSLFQRKGRYREASVFSSRKCCCCHQLALSLSSRTFSRIPASPSGGLLLFVHPPPFRSNARVPGTAWPLSDSVTAVPLSEMTPAISRHFLPIFPRLARLRATTFSP